MILPDSLVCEIRIGVRIHGRVSGCESGLTMYLAGSYLLLNTSRRRLEASLSLGDVGLEFDGELPSDREGDSLCSGVPLLAFHRVSCDLHFLRSGRLLTLCELAELFFFEERRDMVSGSLVLVCHLSRNFRFLRISEFPRAGKRDNHREHSPPSDSSSLGNMTVSATARRPRAVRYR